jgi:fatty-acyl-CoA synthase
MAAHFRLTSDSAYLWTLPMFHCNGWCFTWAVTAAGGTHVCLPRPVPRDGRTLGEVALRGNNVMLGYYRDEEATRTAVPDGWLRTGDLGVLHPDGYLEIRDRAKDVIISGGENISSVEVEAVLMSHPAVLEAAVVAVPDAKWGERPAAWVTLADGATATADELRAHVRERLAGFKVPDRVTFAPLPKTATGKVQKFRLRDEAWAGRRPA